MTRPFVIAKFLSIYFIKPVDPTQALKALSCGFPKVIDL
jgi:hypothetical protein